MPFAGIERRVAGIRAPLVIKLQVGFLLVIGVLALTGGVSLLAIGGIRKHASDLDRIDAAVHSALGIDHSIVLQEHLSSMFVLTREGSYAAKLMAEQRRFRSAVEHLGAQAATPEEVAALSGAFARYVLASDTVRERARAGDRSFAQAVHVAQEHAIAHEIEALTKALAARLRTQQDDKHREMLAAQRWTTWMVATAFIFSIGLALALGRVLARATLEPVRKVDAALDRIAGGDFVTVDDVNNRDELGSLVANVNRTSGQLAALYAKEHQTAQTLKDQLAALEDTQAQLRQALKMEAVGQLAGGVAHDFNNLLTIIAGRAHVLLGEPLAADPTTRRHIELISKTAERAGGLTRQLLAFSRKQVLQPRVIELVALIEDLAPMLERLVGEHIALRTALDERVGRIRADPSQMEQVLLNLAVNARDAMARGGTLTIELTPATLPDERGEGSPTRAGISLVVRDTGVGIPPEVQPHLFEPFFTTKAPGKGTGLGLATVYGIVTQSGGSIRIASEPGLGTSVMIWLPCTADEAEPAGAGGREAGEARGRETILLVEDEDDIRDLVAETLLGRGYTVIQARDGADALRVVGESNRPIDLVLTDVVMPNLSGRDLVRQLSETHPRLNVLYISGYTVDALGDHGVLEAGTNLLYKPFAPQQLLTKLREVLDRAALTART
jgi:signal transduction histidine kinase/ActR/RegA family two-component response regulator